jgi:tetratricopeptide (TPR) repeat protein/predicted Ser/Thr protein kinase
MNTRVAELFHALVDLSPEERMRYLVEHDIDEETWQEAEQLLAFDSRDSAPLLRDIGLVAGRTISQIDSTGRRCGPYRLVGVIGRGGMGVVYLAERVDGEVTQRAAVKLLQPGLHDTQRERFLQEREILAALTHPNIAHLLDAGHLEDGQPFLAMEYVEGKAIDVFTAGFGVRQKIRLFLKVCSAVSYLHRNLVVHRDLKPGNIVVTKDGEPKLLDFGIAKILDLTADSTVTGMRMLTPDYASPEQVMGSRISTTSDIYSLAAVLYQLLTGKPPHTFEDASPGAIASAISAREVTRPSKWAPGLKGDLELILMKALRKDPQARYSTVEQFAEDLEAFLESRPIRARKGDLVYRARKLARRYWVPLAAAALILASLSIGLYVANRERAVAQRRFDEVRRLSNKLFDIDRRVLALPGNARTRQLIVDTALDYLSRLASDVQGDPELALDMATAYMRVGRVQGVPISPNLGQPENAEQNLRIAESFIHSVLAERPDLPAAMLRAAQIAHDRMILAQARRPDTDALPLARESERWLEKYLSSGRADNEEMNQVSLLGANVANWYVRKDLFDDALRLLGRTIEVVRAANQPEQASRAYLIMARALRSTGDLDAALAAVRDGVSLLEALPADKKQGWALNMQLALLTQGEILGEDNAVSLGRTKEATDYFERAYKLAVDWAARDPSDAHSRFAVSGMGIRLAGVLRHSEPRRALAIYDEALRHIAEVKNNSRARRDEVRALAWSTYPLRQMGQSAEARARLDSAFARLGEMKLYPADQVIPGSEADNALTALAEYEAGRGRVLRGIETYQQLLDRIMASKPKPESSLWDATDLSNIYAAMAVLYRRARLPDPASDLESRRADLWLYWDRKLPNNPFARRQLADSSARLSALPKK